MQERQRRGGYLCKSGRGEQTRALMRWAQDRFGGLTDGTKNSVKFLVASFHRHSEDFSQSWTREFLEKT